jgi:hypothetical protein
MHALLQLQNDCSCSQFHTSLSQFTQFLIPITYSAWFVYRLCSDLYFLKGEGHTSLARILVSFPADSLRDFLSHSQGIPRKYDDPEKPIANPFHILIYLPWNMTASVF